MSFLTNFLFFLLISCITPSFGVATGKGKAPEIICEDRRLSRLARYARRTQGPMVDAPIDTECDESCWDEQSEPDDTTSDVFNSIKNNGQLITQFMKTGKQMEESLQDGDLYQLLSEQEFDGFEMAEGLEIEEPIEDDGHRRLGIFGEDERFEIRGNPITSDPEKYVGVLRFNNAGQCTATLIGNTSILTAAHCVHAGNGGGWFSNIRFRPRRNRDDSSTAISVDSCSVFKGWAEQRKGQWDFAICQLETSPGIGYSGFGYNSSLGTEDFFQITGYPADKAFGTMWGTTDFLSNQNWAYLFTDDTDTKGGMSGGPWTNDMIYATHRGFVGSQNQGVRITKNKYDWLCNIMGPDRC